MNASTFSLCERFRGDTMQRKPTVRLAVTLAAITTSSLAAYWLWDHRSYWLVENFRAVEPGRVYAGGYQYPIPLRRVVDRYQIRTVLSLREGGDEYESQERSYLKSRGIRFEKVVIPYKVPEEERIAAIERAIEVIADENNHPIYVHCWAGCHRTGAVVAIYRVSRCGWSEEAARQELITWGGTARGAQWPLRILGSYCSRTIATR